MIVLKPMNGMNELAAASISVCGLVGQVGARYGRTAIAY